MSTGDDGGDWDDDRSCKKYLNVEDPDDEDWKI